MTLHPPSFLSRCLSAFLLALLSACGGGGGGGGGGGSAPSTTATPGATTSRATPGAPVSGPAITGNNAVQIVVDQGLKGSSINVPYVTVTVCAPATASCVDIDHVVVDTGSTGLRVTQAALNGLVLPGVTTRAGNPAAECAQFASGFAWGSVRRADVRLGAQTATVSVQVTDDPAFPSVPSGCTNTGGNIQGGGEAKGILGVGLFVTDCGSACDLGSPAVPAVYYGCPTPSTCGVGTVAVASQVTNPVAQLPTDNNGVVIVLPAVPPGGVTRATGTMLLGINTQANNQLGSATVFTTDTRGYFSTTYNGVNYPRSFIDSGSNGYFFTDAALAKCTVSTQFYCPPSSLALSAVQAGTNGASVTVTFPLEAVDPLPGTTTAAHIGGDPGQSLNQSFDWGLPFFFGRTVFTGIAGRAAAGGPTGPYFAW